MNEMLNSSKLRRYLLDQLPGAEAEEVELNLIADDRSFELLGAVEEELIDDYVRNALSSAEARALLDYLGRLPDGRERLRFARALPASSLAARGEAASSPGAPLPRPAATSRRRFPLFAAAAALLVVSVVSAATILQLFDRIGELEAALRESATTAEPLETAPPRAPFVLSSGALRGASSLPRVLVASSDPLVELELDLAEDTHGRYRATLRDVDGNELVSMSRLSAVAGPDQVRVSFLVPAAVLAPGDYYVELDATGPSEASETLARFDFRAVAR